MNDLESETEDTDMEGYDLALAMTQRLEKMSEKLAFQKWLVVIQSAIIGILVGCMFLAGKFVIQIGGPPANPAPIPPANVDPMPPAGFIPMPPPGEPVDPGVVPEPLPNMPKEKEQDLPREVTG